MTRGEIWWADLGVPFGSEPGFRRPVLVVQADSFNQSRIGTVPVRALHHESQARRCPGQRPSGNHRIRLAQGVRDRRIPSDLPRPRQAGRERRGASSRRASGKWKQVSGWCSHYSLTPKLPGTEQNRGAARRPEHPREHPVIAKRRAAVGNTSEARAAPTVAQIANGHPSCYLRTRLGSPPTTSNSSGSVHPTPRLRRSAPRYYPSRRCKGSTSKCLSSDQSA